MAAFCGQLQEVPETLMSKDGQLKPGLLIHIQLEDYTGMLESDLRFCNEEKGAEIYI